MILIILSILRLTKILLLYKNIRKFLKDKGIICIVKKQKKWRRVMMPEEIKKAIEDVNVARNNLRHCNTENFDKCCIYLTAVEEKLNALIKYQKTVKKMVA